MMNNEIIVILQGLAVITIYVILWDYIWLIVNKLHDKYKVGILISLLIFLFITSGYSFNFLKEWGVRVNTSVDLQKHHQHDQLKAKIFYFLILVVEKMLPS